MHGTSPRGRFSLAGRLAALADAYLVAGERNSVRKRTRAIEKAKRLVSALCSCMASVALTVSLSPAPAFADDVSDAQSALDAAEARMKDISTQYDKINSELTSIQQQIDSTAKDALDAQQAVITGRDALGVAARNEYRSPSVESLLVLVLESGSFEELTRNVTYANAILQSQADEVAAQKERVSVLDGITQELNKQKDSQQRALKELDQTKQEAQSVVSQAEAKLQTAKDAAAESARLEALKTQAQNMSEQESSSGGEEVSDKSNTTTREEVVPDNTPVTPNPDPDPPSSDDSSNSSAGWQTGTASAYGGSTDPYTPNPGTTATGDVCDDYSMGVAIPMSWPNCTSYLGRTVQISYNGTTVYATINDYGYMGGGSRALDLQPGVWKAFGFSSCNDWGVRTVSYRIL